MIFFVGLGVGDDGNVYILDLIDGVVVNFGEN